MRWALRLGGLSLPSPTLSWPLAKRDRCRRAEREGEPESDSERVAATYSAMACSASHHIGCGVTSPRCTLRQ